ncbi:VOC family protein [Micromonospora sp. LH3U1]|uniref:VOC family protein n=1 Tax=Micromonospora sp. LH3U1 TaxID=3018339 RepID=UPI00234B5565|nr:VOC family protein [Micromonospora sp. LH3U1]WCN80567.1 VOC family protein [Micromonospora sp. LH3U1]
MSINTVAHINLRGNARAALEFYRSVFGGDLAAVTYADAHNVQNPDEADQIMWGQVTSAEGFQIMAYDVPSVRPWSQGESPFFVSVRGRDADEITGYWKKLSEGSTVVVDLAPAGWAPLYGMLTDPFGITWVLDVAVAYNPS